MRRGGYELLEVELGPGDLLLAYSDGVVDAQSPDGEFFGEERLVEVLSNGVKSPKQVVDSVIQNLREFTQGTEPYDDVTLVVAQRIGGVA
jgi:serine phosphatase RsbU (regulator of sigma subunit)